MKGVRWQCVPHYGSRSERPLISSLSHRTI
jgi:hypothetical protein